MRAIIALACFLYGAAPAFAQNEPESDRHPVAAGNNWSLTDSQCLLDAVWEGDLTIMVNRHDDHYDLGLYDRRMKRVVDEKVIPVRFGAGGTIVSGREYVALGHRNAEATAYVSDVDEPLLDRIAAANTFQFYRGKDLLADLDMTGFREALDVMHACQARLSEPGEPNDEPVAREATSTAGAETGSEAASDAAAQP
jgi:hypothetical protein